MDLTLSRRGDYVVRAAIHLARNWDGEGGYTKIREVADEMALLGVLARAGLAEAKAGRAGGYRLRRDPSTITVLEVIEAAEGDLISRRCPMRGGPCHWDNACALHPTWVDASEAIRSTLSGTTLAEVVVVDRRLARGESIGDVPAGGRGSSSRRAVPDRGEGRMGRGGRAVRPSLVPGVGRTT
jgi:Rrf2 family protein